MILQLNYYSKSTYNLFADIPSSDDCAFCVKYFSDCLGCPICKKTGHTECDTTPFREVIHLKIYNTKNNTKNYGRVFKAISDEINFLINL